LARSIRSITSDNHGRPGSRGHRRSSRPLGDGGRRSLRQSRAASPPLSPKPRRRSCFLTSPPATALELSIAGAARALTCRNGRTDENRTGAAPPAPSAARPSCCRRSAPLHLCCLRVGTNAGRAQVADPAPPRAAEPPSPRLLCRRRGQPLCRRALLLPLPPFTARSSGSTQSSRAGPVSPGPPPFLSLSSSPSLSLSPLCWFGGDWSRRPMPAPGLSHDAATNQGARPRHLIQLEHATSPGGTHMAAAQPLPPPLLLWVHLAHVD
jgi:hypothetical protein